MKRFFVIFAVLLALCWTAPSYAAWSDMWANVYRWSGGYNQDGSPTVTLATTGITYRVQATGADTKETLYKYNDNTFTPKSNAVSKTMFATDKQIAFRTDPTDATSDRYVDLIVVDTVGGYTTVVKNFDKYTHAVIIDERPNVVHHGIIMFDLETNASVEAIALSKHTFINNLMPEVLAAYTSGAYSVGVSTASSAFRYGSMSAVGYSSLAANVGAMQMIAGSNSNNYFTTSTTSVYVTGQNALAAGTNKAYFGNIHFWFTVMR